jgi:Uncharacterized conserved protein related to C-terminal domain of eukaryotic chaperone, SACSIN|uniref:HEPN domain-containing protein n=1 Tax=Ignisphaera aggregans TaxID=334771 RepID=A0A7J2T9F1_9CREN
MSSVYLDENEYSRWIRSAELTLESAKKDLEFGDYSWACFKAHQAVEKALKAFLWGIGKPRVGHSLTYLLRYLSDTLNEKPSDDVVYACSVLDKYYIPTRYPDVWVEGIPEEYFTQREAEEAIKLALRVIEWVKELWQRLSRRD